jgi:hypothetical protein
MYGAAIVMAGLAAHSAASMQGIHDSRASELTLVAALVFAVLWANSIYHIMSRPEADVG